MIKRINPHNFLTTPFIAVKSWELFNIENDDVLLLEPYISGSLIPDTAVAQDYVDYYGTNPALNSECDIALEQQTQDVLIYQEGLSGSGKFFPASEATNPDGTYKRLVYNTINKAFYNKYNDPTKIFGVEYIDFPLSRTVRNIADNFRVFNVPQLVYGDKIVPGTVQLYDTSLDDNMVITDDRYQNLIAGYNLFSKVQEVRDFGNTLFTGSATASCPPYGALSITSPLDYYADISSSAFFYTTASGTMPFYYQWQTGSTNIVDNAKFTGSNSATLRINDIEMGDVSSSYRVLVSNPLTGITSSYATLYINLYPPTVSGPDDIFLSVGDNALFDVTSSLSNVSVPGALPLTYKWQSGSTYLVDDARITGSVLVGNLSSSLVINNVTYTDTGSYRAMVSNFYGGVTSSYATLYITPPPGPDWNVGGIGTPWQVYQGDFGGTFPPTVNLQFNNSGFNINLGIELAGQVFNYAIANTSITQSYSGSVAHCLLSISQSIINDNTNTAWSLIQDATNLISSPGQGGAIVVPKTDGFMTASFYLSAGSNSNIQLYFQMAAYGTSGKSVISMSFSNIP